MKAAFIHDHVFSLSDDGKFYSPGKLKTTSFSRYLDVFDSLTIISRSKPVHSATEVKTYNEIIDSRIKFNSFDDQSNVKNRFIKRSYYSKLMQSIISDYDAIIIRLPSEIGFLAAEVCQRLNKKYVVEVVACPEDAMVALKSLKGFIYSKFIKSVMATSVWNAYGALYVTNEFLQDKYPTKTDNIVVASNVEIDSYAEMAKEFIPKQAPSCVLVGNLDSPHKGYDVLYKSLEILDDLKLKLDVYLVGAGNRFKKDVNFTSVNVIYTGALEKENLISLYDRVDFLIQPSSQEGLPRATIEGMSRALPCIVSNAGGLPELINKKFVHDKNDFKSLSELIVLLLSDPDIYFTESARNLEESRRYNSELLSKIRNTFFNEYNKVLV